MDPDLSIDMPKYNQLVIYEDYEFSFLDVWIIAECVSCFSDHLCGYAFQRSSSI